MKARLVEAAPILLLLLVATDVIAPQGSNRAAKHPNILWPIVEDMGPEGQGEEDEQRFIADKRPQEELDDLRADPHETRNVAEEPKYKEIARQLRREVETWGEATSD